MFQSYEDWENNMYRNGDLIESCSTYEDWVQGLNVDDSDDYYIDLELDISREYVLYLIDEKNKDRIPQSIADEVRVLINEIKEQAINGKVLIQVAPFGFLGDEHIDYNTRVFECNMPQKVKDFANKTKCYMGIIYAMACIAADEEKTIHRCRLTAGSDVSDYIADNMAIFSSKEKHIREYAATSIMNDIFWNGIPSVVNELENGDDIVDEVVEHYFNQERAQRFYKLCEDIHDKYDWDNDNPVASIVNRIYKEKLIGICENETTINEILDELYEFNKHDDIMYSIDKEYSSYCIHVPFFFGKLMYMIENLEGNYYASIVARVLLDLYGKKYKVNFEDIQEENETIRKYATLI